MNINEMTEFKPETMLNPYFLIGSEKLFLTPTNNFINQFKYGHIITLIESQDRASMTKDDITAENKKLYRNLAIHWKINYQAKVFVGYKQDCLFLYDLYRDYGITFDAAVFINFDFSQISNKDAEVKDSTVIYNFYSDKKKYGYTKASKVNQYIPVRIGSPAYSKRFAMETAGVLTYGTYNVLDIVKKTPSQYYSSNKEFTLTQ